MSGERNPLRPGPVPGPGLPILRATALCVALGWASSALARDEPIRFSSAPAGSLYLEIARSVAEAIPGVEPVDSAGSLENLRRLERGEARFALAQQDVVSEYLRDRTDRGEESEIRVVDRVLFDYLHIFVRRPIHVEQASDFRRFRIWLGEEESGTRKTAMRFLESVGVPYSSLYEPPTSLEDLYPPGLGRELAGRGGSWVNALPALLRAETLDVAMLMDVPGIDSVCSAMKSGRMSLFPLDYQTLRLLTGELESAAVRRQIAIGNIPSGTYVGQEAPVPTIAVPTLLVARRGESPALAREVLAAAQARWSELAGTVGDEGCRYPEEFPPVASLAESNLRRLAGFGDEPPVWWRRHGWAIFSLAAGLAVLGLASWGVRLGWHLDLVQLWRQEKGAARAVLALGVGVLAITILTYLLERRINEDFSTPWESFWSITVYLFSGLEDRNPYTPAGRLVAAFGLLLGPLFFAFLTGWLARVFIRWEKRMPNNLKDHCLLLNWNDRAIRVVRELHHELVVENKGVQVIVVLTDDEALTVQRLKASGMGEEEVFEDVYLSVGDPTADKALLNANAQDAKTIVILSDDSRPEHADERSIRSLVMLRRIARDKGRKDLHVIIELADSANEGVIDEIARDFPGVVERVSGLQVRTCMIAQAALSSGVTQFYRDLLRVSQDTNEIYVEPIPEAAVGMTFREYAAAVLQQDSETPLIPVGVQRAVDGLKRMFSNPRPGHEGYVLEPGDAIVLLGYEAPKKGALPVP